MAHEHHHHHKTGSTSGKNIRMAFFINLFFTIIEIAGGLFSNSVAILSNAIHDLGDCLSLGMAWYFQKIATKNSDTSYSYGYKRFSLLGAVINSIVLATGSIIILSVAIQRILHPEVTKTDGMILFALLGILVNGAAVFKLKKGDSINEKVARLHLLEDVLGWLAVFIGSVVMKFVNIPLLDPIMSIGIACFVLINVIRNLRQSLRIILQGIPRDLDSTEIHKLLLQFKDIEDVHDLHIWSVDGIYNVLTVHVVLEKKPEMEKMSELKSEIRTSLKEKGIQHATIEFETEDERCIFEQCC